MKYYKKLGYDHIFIYDNNNINDERFQKVLLNYISDDFVTIIDYRGFRGKNNHPQFDAYFDCYQKNYKNYDWLSFFDFDEFLELKNNVTIKQYLSDPIFNKCQNIKINWLFYSGNDNVYYENKSLLERFPKPLLNDSSNVSTKSITRGKLRINYWYITPNPHTTSLPYISCNSVGKIMTRRYFRKCHYNSPPNYERAALRHYATKSIEEFCKKIKRGYPDQKVDINKNYLKGNFDYYFERNNITDEKLAFIKEFFNYDYK